MFFARRDTPRIFAPLMSRLNFDGETYFKCLSQSSQTLMILRPIIFFLRSLTIVCTSGSSGITQDSSRTISLGGIRLGSVGMVMYTVVPLPKVDSIQIFPQ